MANNPPYKITIIAPTCFYYQAPLFRTLAADDRLDLKVMFCTDEGISGTDIKATYGANKLWGDPGNLLGGYRSEFLKNYAFRGSYLKSLVGLVNLKIWGELKRDRPNAVAIMSWMNPTWWLTILACLRFKIPILLMTDANVDAEDSGGNWKSGLKNLILGKVVFKAVSGFLCAGAANKQLYIYYGVADEKLFPFAYSWGYGYMLERSKEFENRKDELREEYQLPKNAIIALYCGRFSPEKGSLELVEAYKNVSNPKKALVLVGDGRLRNQMQRIADRLEIDSIYFMGFQTRQDIAKFYSLADLLVLPSHKETWGMVVNEGLCFSLPVVLSDQVGSRADLVTHGENGYVFSAGDVSDLTVGLSTVVDLSEEDRSKMGKKSKSVIVDWTERDIASVLVDYFESSGSDSNTKVIRMLLKIYRWLPEFVAHLLAVSIISSLWGAGQLFLIIRPVIRRLRAALLRFRG